MIKKQEVSRREFLMTGGATATGLAAMTGTGFLLSPSRVMGANNRVRVALCGLNGRGVDHMKAYAQISNVQIAALCDVDENVLRARLADLEKMGVPRPKTYTDVRKLFDDKSIDAVSIATPNHWHSLMAIWACQAGKDVYVEKPCSHNLWEGRQLVRAAQKYKRIVQHGTQSRSVRAVAEAVQRLRAGALGDLYLSRGLCFKWRDTIGHAPVEPVPSGVHYDLWTGPAPMKAFTRNRFHYNWHWIWDTGNGDLGNQGIHQVDLARWGLGLKFPNKISAIGGHFMFDDDQQTPNTLNCAFEYSTPGKKPTLLEFEVRHWISNYEAGIGTPLLGSPVQETPPPGSHARLGPLAGTHNTIGNVYYGPKGYMGMADGDPYAYQIWLGPDMTRGPHGQSQSGDELIHFSNFIDCVISRKSENLHAPIEEGHISCALVHLANASYRLGRTLHFDPATEQVIGDDEANRLLRDGDRGYRAPYVVPNVV